MCPSMQLIVTLPFLMNTQHFGLAACLCYQCLGVIHIPVILHVLKRSLLNSMKLPNTLFHSKNKQSNIKGWGPCEMVRGKPQYHYLISHSIFTYYNVSWRLQNKSWYWLATRPSGYAKVGLRPTSFSQHCCLVEKIFDLPCCAVLN